MRDGAILFLGLFQQGNGSGILLGGRGWREPLLEFYITRAIL